MKKRDKLAEKRIALDAPTTQFLSSLRSLRKTYGIKVREVADFLSIDAKSIYRYERGNSLPKLGNLMKLTELFGYNLSESLNYKYFYNRRYRYKIKKMIRQYGFCYAELSDVSGYSNSHIQHCVNLKHSWGLQCLSELFDAISKENKKYRNIEKLLETTKKRISR